MSQHPNVENFLMSRGVKPSELAVEILTILFRTPNKTVGELVIDMDVVAKTVRYWLKKLKEAKIVVTIPNLNDMRSEFLRIHPDISATLEIKDGILTFI